MRFNIIQLVQFRGGATFRDTNSAKTCKNESPSTSACKMEAMHTFKETCLECNGLNSEKLIITNQGFMLTEILCKTESNPSTPKRSPTSPNFPNYYTGCELYQRATGSSCVGCHSDCVTCTGSGSNQCAACNWELNQEKTALETCGSCPSGQFSEFGECINCQGSCTSGCPNGVCVSCSPTQNLFNQICCSRNQYSDGISCFACHSSCSTCFKDGSNGCLTCPAASALNYITNECVASCDHSKGKFYNTETSVCANCSSGCKECLSSTFCTLCDVQKGYRLENNQCVLFCDVSEGKYVNTEDHPPACESCEGNCLSCSDGTTCIVCNEGYSKDTSNGCTLTGNMGTPVQSSGGLNNQEDSPKSNNPGTDTPNTSNTQPGTTSLTQNQPETFAVYQIAPIDSFSDFCLKVVIPAIEKYNTSIRFSIFDEPAKNPQKIFEITSKSTPLMQINSLTTRTKNGDLIIMGNFTEVPQEEGERASLIIQVVATEINQDPEITLSAQELEAIIKTPLNIDSEEVDSAASSGKSISRITVASSSVLEGISALLAGFGADPSGVEPKSSKGYGNTY